MDKGNNGMVIVVPPVLQTAAPEPSGYALISMVPACSAPFMPAW